MLDGVLAPGPVAGRLGAVTLQAITVIGHDRPGIIAEATAALAGLGLNLEDSTMTLLRGHFAMMLLCAGDVVHRAGRGGVGVPHRRRFARRVRA